MASARTVRTIALAVCLVSLLLLSLSPSSYGAGTPHYGDDKMTQMAACACCEGSFFFARKCCRKCFCPFWHGCNTKG